MSLLETLPIVTPIQPQELDELKAACAADGFRVWMPTHVIRTKQEITGYYTIANLPFYHHWFSKKTPARQSIELIQTGFNIARGIGMSRVIIPCMKESPFFPYIERLGGVKMGETVLFTKNLWETYSE